MNLTDEQIMERTQRGWLRPHLLALDLKYNGRWEYWIRTYDAGQVLDEPIPQIDWVCSGHPEPKKNLEQCVDLCRDRFSRDGYSLFVDWLLFGFGDPLVQEYPEQITLSLNANWYKTFDLEFFLKSPADYLGDYAAELYGKGRNNPTGYFPTPMEVSVLMAQVTLKGCDKTNSICDPCVGSGRLLMAASNYSLNLYGVDIDLAILKACKVNMWMYVPWGLGRPDSLKGFEKAMEPFEEGDGSSGLRKVTPEVQQELLKQSGQLELFVRN